MRSSMAKRMLCFALIATSAALATCLWHTASDAPDLRPVIRTVAVRNGVLVWRDSGEEVALLGVNYYAPFWCDYDGLKAKGIDPRVAIDEDIRHMRRLGLDYVRIHVFDTQVSDDNGGIVETVHLGLLDYLLDRIAREGLYAVVTPIAWWNAKGEGAFGFSRRWKMEEMTSNADAIRTQCRFLGEFARRSNRYSGFRYADDPVILAFELINEPLYKKDCPDASVTSYVNALAEALRATGTDKPIFYNSWHGRDAAVAASRVDGLTGSFYPTGLSSGMCIEGNMLGSVRGSSLASARGIVGKAKMVYEYNAADTMTAYMHPALAWCFRSEGVQMAAQFQYDACALASENMSWPTHYLNLVYTPKVAMSVAIAAEIMRRLPSGVGFSNDGMRMSYGPFVVDGKRDFAVCSDKTVYLSSGDTDVTPPLPERLRRVWGCGSSPVVATSGNGCYFLDCVSSGVWRLQLYPNVFEVADPFSGLPGVKTAVLPDPVRLSVRLPAFADGYCAWNLGGKGLTSASKKGEIALFPGDYLLTAGAPPSMEDVVAAESLGVPRFSAPIPPIPYERPKRVVGLSDIRKSALARISNPDEWNFLDIATATRRKANGELPNRRLTHDDCGRDAVWFGAESFADQSFVAFRFVVSCEDFASRFPERGNDTNAVLCVHIRSCQPETRRIEMMYMTSDGVSRVCELPVDPTWRDVKVPLSAFSVARWSDVKAPQCVPTVASICKFGFTLGRWLRTENSLGPQSVEISSIRVVAGECIKAKGADPGLW